MTTVRVVAVGDALGRRLRLVALVEGDEGADEAEDDALDDAVADVAPDVDARLHDRPEVAGVDADQEHRDDVGAEDADRREQDRQDRHRDDAAEKARRQDAALRVDRHHVHRRELLARLHQADLGGERRAGAAGEKQRRDDRPELARQREVDDQAERLGGAVGDERVVHLQRQDEADREPGGEDDDQREVADRVDLGDDQVGPAQRRRAGAQERRRRRSRGGRGCAAPRACAAPSRVDADPVTGDAPPRCRAQARTPKSSASGRAG